MTCSRTTEASGRLTFADGPRQPRRSVNPGVVVGGGMAFALSPHIDMGPEARVFILAPESGVDVAMAWTLGVRLGYRF